MPPPAPAPRHAEHCGHFLAGQRPLAETDTVRDGLKDALVVDRQHRRGDLLTPHRHLRFRVGRITGRQLPARLQRPGGGSGAGVSGAVRSQNRIDPPAGDHPLLPFLLGRGQLGLNTVGLLTQAIDPTPSKELTWASSTHRRCCAGRRSLRRVPRRGAATAAAWNPSAGSRSRLPECPCWPTSSPTTMRPSKFALAYDVTPPRRPRWVSPPTRTWTVAVPRQQRESRLSIPRNGVDLTSRIPFGTVFIEDG